MPTPPPVSLTNLPYELIITIFTLSSNPSFLFTCKELHHILAPLSRSNSTRINFLLIRYRNNYVKAVIKGLRWKFFDLGLLNALDRLYTRDTQRKAEADARYILHSNAPLTFNGLAWLDTITPADSPSAPCTPEENSTPPASQSREPPKKKRKKYQIPIPESYLQKRTLASSSSRPSSPFPNQLNDSNTTISTDSSDSTAAFNQTIPLPKDFSMPRRLFKSSEYLPLIRELLIRGGSPSYPSHYPLVRASQRGDVDMVRLLLSFGAPPDMRAYPAYASYKAINSRDNTRLTAWLMYWAVMGIFTLVEFVLDTFVFWLPFYYEVKMLFVLWMILPQTQGSIYLYQTWVDPYLSQHEHEIDRTLKDIKKQAMVMGMQYIKQAIQTIQNLTLDIYKKSQNQPLSSQSADSITMSSDRSIDGFGFWKIFAESEDFIV
ncbi:hypothetical protein BGX28_000452 [Mortierella sp. GBA30]|nr:hypothetical protein BGX28_000452 [Mortierella sp. GBA30]